MEKVNCDLCRADDYEILEHRGRFGLPVRNVVCKRCGLVYINPRMSETKYRDFNLKDYRRIYNKPQDPTKEFTNYQLYRGKIIFDFLSEYIKQGSRVLDVSCTVGGVLEVFRRKLGCEVYGTETETRLAEYASRKFNIKIFNGFFEDSSFPESFFDLIIMSHTLEHFYSPTRALQLAREILKAEGKIYIEVPNILKPYRKITWFFQNAHPYTFSPKTLALICEKMGFEIIKLDQTINIRILAKTHEVKKLIFALNNNGHYLEIIKAIKKYKLRYLLYLRYLNFLKEKFYRLKRKIGRLVKKYERLT